MVHPHVADHVPMIIISVKTRIQGSRSSFLDCVDHVRHAGDIIHH